MSYLRRARWWSFLSAALCVCIAFVLAACSNNPPTPPSPLPPSSGQWQTYGGVEPQVTNNTFQFPTSVSGTAGYFYTKPPQVEPGLLVTLIYSITGSGPVWAQHPQPPPAATDSNPASLTLFLWRQGDDLGGGATGKASYRFWCSQRALLVLGVNQTLKCRLNSNVWTNVAGVHDPAGFLAALQNYLGVGFTFGGAQFYGHGVYLSAGSATFTINAFMVK